MVSVLDYRSESPWFEAWSLVVFLDKKLYSCGRGRRGRVGGVLPRNRLMRMCRWMELYFHDWID